MGKILKLHLMKYFKEANKPDQAKISAATNYFVKLN